jgi:hypothetical protein
MLGFVQRRGAPLDVEPALLGDALLGPRLQSIGARRTHPGRGPVLGGELDRIAKQQNLRQRHANQ